MRSIIGSPTQCPCMQHATRCMYTRAALPPPLVHPLGPSHSAMERARRPLSIAPPLGQATRCCVVPLQSRGDAPSRSGHQASCLWFGLDGVAAWYARGGATEAAGVRQCAVHPPAHTNSATHEPSLSLCLPHSPSVTHEPSLSFCLPCRAIVGGGTSCPALWPRPMHRAVPRTRGCFNF
jgi:hypothetical protein